MLSKEILWIIIVGTIVLGMVSTVMLLDTLDEMRHQRRARQAFWDWILFTKRRRLG